MAIRMMEDIAAPGLVSAVDLITLGAAPEWNEWASYGLTAIGYLAGAMNFGGEFVKRLGPCSLPLTVRHIRDRVKAGDVTRRTPAGATAMSYRPVNTGYSPSIRQTVLDPEFGGVKVS